MSNSYAILILTQDFESKIVNAAKAGKRSELVYLQKVFESEILLAILKSLNETATDLDTISENLVIQNETPENTSKIREKRAIGLFTQFLGSSSGSGGAGGGAGGGTGSGGDAGVRQKY